ncbi:DNA-directed RNA polymerase I, putative [Theileria equi strain WA]|uniref:DNA-directed RNA polymerase subunit n=1 Tax=Theileria equi strain WA TaxID=1537102 RepID=L1LEL6_THEEQ|nr:DNA-directed RNA polymerase I, putative [Theileria equi strain WA]EKX73872.1 DNA-directed RNA polymerase I, putative [Theileria equi strain WA]|eukprot:XP_004833324.1 DNA-directed RNA polymerase I, putative [Theileria equi strain WA]
MLSYDTAVSTEVEGISLSFLSNEEIHTLSVSEIKNIGRSGYESAGKSCIYDPALGSSDIYKHCSSCNEMTNCDGHLGHIDFAVPLFHPLMLPSLVKLLKTVCFYCLKLKLRKKQVLKFQRLFDLAKAGMLSDLIVFDQLFGNDKDDDEKDAEASNRTKLHQLSKESKKDHIKKILFKLKKVAQVRSGGDAQATNLTRLKNSSNFDVNIWNEIRNRFFAIGAKTKRCNHCGDRNSIAVKQSADSTHIEISWAPSSLEPKVFKDFQKYQGKYGEKDKETERVINMLNEEFESPMLKGLNATGKSINMMHLQAFHLVPALNKLFTENPGFLGNIFPQSRFHGWRIFIMDCMGVSPNRFRPPLVTSDKQIVLHARSSALLEIVIANEFLKILFRVKNHPNIQEAFKDEEYISKLLGYNVNETQLRQFEEYVCGSGCDFNSSIYNHTLNLQRRLSMYMDSGKQGTSTLAQRPGIKQSMEHKSGTVRQNMLGKRVNYSARTVIAPDCFMDTNQMGMPLKFAMELTIPEHVTKYNVNFLRKLVLNGSKIYPGANFLRDSNGRLYSLSTLSYSERVAKAKLLLTGITEGNSPRIVYRHVLDGDVALMNRQPTLHKPGIMGHFIKVLTNQKIFRLNYVNCSTYNADFDGDEMNLHLPQDPLSQAEAQLIANADCQFVVPKNGQPIRGLIQDHCQGGALLTSKNTFLRKDEYFNLIYVSLDAFISCSDNIYLKDEEDTYRICENIKIDNELYQITKRLKVMSDPFSRKFPNHGREIYIDPPAIVYPVPLWTGKQVITSILKTLVDGMSTDIRGGVSKGPRGINLVSKSKTPGDAWGGSNDGNKEESTIIIQNSELLQGVLDKSQFGASSYGLTHLIFELLGPRICGMLLNSFSYLFTSFLQMHGVTCSPKDFILTSDAERLRIRILRRIKYTGLHIQQLFISAMREKFEKKNNALSSGDAPHAVILSALEHLIDEVGKVVNLPFTRDILLECKSTDRAREIIGMLFHHIAQVSQKDDLLNLILKSLEKLSSVPRIKQLVLSYILMLKNGDSYKPQLLSSFPSWLHHDPTDVHTTREKENVYKLGGAQSTCSSFHNLICDRFRGNEQEFYRMFDRFFQNNIVGVSSDINSVVDSTLLKFPENGFFGMVATGAKGSKVNFAMICSALSQQTLEGRRVPVMPSIRTLPSFAFGDFGSRAGGFISDRFLTGLRPQEYFFHCMSGREGLVDTCVKTAKSGYLQRCVLKAMEDVIVCYDATVRGSDGSIIQFAYGEDGIDVSKSAYLDRPRDIVANSHLIPQDEVAKVNVEASEKFMEKMRLFTSNYQDQRVLLVHYKHSQCDAGDAVGCVAGQSIGEPATQMTLNTFHLAGHGAANVTLGIPRLIELLRTTGDSSTPYFSATLLGQDEAKIAKNAQLALNALRTVPLSDIVHSVGIETDVYARPDGSKVWEYTATVQFENLSFFKKVVGGFKTQNILKLTSNCLLNRFLRRVMGLMVVTMDVNIPYELPDNTDYLEECWNTLVLQKQLIKKDKQSLRIRKMVLSSGSSGKVARSKDREEPVDDEPDVEIEEQEPEEDVQEEEDESETECGSDSCSYSSSESDEDAEQEEEDTGYKGFESEIKFGKQDIRSIDRKVFRFAHSLKFCKDTSRLILKFGWPVSKCPYYLDLLPLLKQEISQETLRKSPGIRQSRVVLNNSHDGKDDYTLHCDGTNLKRVYLLKEGIIDFNKIKINDISTVLHYYGVEAARACIVSELNKVFSVYGIDVNYRHLTLIADFMTQKGDIRAFSRYGMAKHNSPLLQMSFESTMKFLMSASERGAYDNLKTPAGAIIAGKPVHVGSNLCKIMQVINIKERELPNEQNAQIMF